MKIAYVSDLDAHNVRSWSGTTYWLGKTLAEQPEFEVEYITPLKVTHKPYLLLKKVLCKLQGKTYMKIAEPVLLKSYAAQVDERLRELDVDVIFSCGKPPVEYLQTDLPIVFFDDASWPAIVDLYPMFKRVRPGWRRLFEAEERLLQRAALAVYSSDWAANAAIQHYDVDPQKIAVVPLGANFEVSRTSEDIEVLLQQRLKSETYHLLFNGVKWELKGGDIAVETARLLHDNGLNVQLHILGCKPPYEVREYIKVWGFVSKSEERGRQLIQELYEKAHFLFVPTRAEAYGIVFAEASSYGVPSIACDVGGVSTVVTDGQNGKLFDVDASPNEFGAYIESILREPGIYQALARTSFALYEEKLNWDVFGRTVSGLIRKHCV
jgi:glycosyltransferase involved in cell wall biosynthesis